MFVDSALQILDESLQGRKSFLSEILRRWRVFLNALQMLDSEESLLTLLVNNGGKLVVLVLDLLDDFLFDALLFKNSVFHGRALAKGFVGLVEELLELVYLQGGGLLEGHSATAASVQVEVAIVAEGLVVDAAVRRQV